MGSAPAISPNRHATRQAARQASRAINQTLTKTIEVNRDSLKPVLARIGTRPLQEEPQVVIGRTRTQFPKDGVNPS